MRLPNNCHHILPASVDSRPGGMHGVAEAGLFKEALDLGNFAGDGGVVGAEGDDAEVDGAMGWGGEV